VGLAEAKKALRRSLNFLMYRVEDFDQSAEDARGAPELCCSELSEWRIVDRSKSAL
jgi:hypothetical protein